MSSVFKQLVSVSFILKTLISLGKKKKKTEVGISAAVRYVG